MNKLIFALWCILMASACQPKDNNGDKAELTSDVAESPEALTNLTQAHRLSQFHNKEVIAFDIALYFRGNLRLKGSIYSKTNSTKVLVHKQDGSELLYDGSEVFIFPDTANIKGARFDALTWSYFALAPFKFNDEGTNWTVNGLLPLDSGKAAYPSLKLSFGENIGDAPDDWYIIFQDENTQLLKAMAYIVTFGDTAQDEAAKNPHAIAYSDYIEVEGIPFATTWKFHDWNASDGLGAQLGEALISNIRFMAANEDLFKKTKQHQLVPLK